MRKKDQSIRVNFGDRDFLFDIDDYINIVFDKLIKEIFENESFVDKGDKQLQIISDYLINMGYEKTFIELHKYKSWYSDQNIKERKLLKELIYSRKYNQAKKLLKENFPNSVDSILLLDYLSNVNKILTMINKKEDLVECLMYIRENIINHNDIMCVNDIKLENITNKIVESLTHNDTNILVKTINDILNSEDIFLEINDIILEKEYSILNNELDVVFKQTELVLKVNIL